MKTPRRRYLLPAILLLILAGLWLVGYKQSLQESLDAQLIDAVKQTNITSVQRLLGSGASPNAMRRTPQPPFWVRLWRGLKGGQEAAQSNGLTVLMLACGAWDYSEEEVGPGGFVDPPNPLGRDTSHGDEKMIIIEMLLRRGADVSPKTEYGLTAMDNAFGLYMTKARVLLLRAGAKWPTDPQVQNELMARAVESGDSELVTVVLSHGFDINRPLHNRANPLTRAIERDKQSLVKWLLDHGANINPSDMDDSTPLKVAMEMPGGSPSRDEMLHLLIARGANVNQINKQNQSVLEYGKMRQSGFHTLEILRKAGAK